MDTNNHQSEDNSTTEQGARVTIDGDSADSNVVIGNRNIVVVKGKSEQARMDRNRIAMLEVVQNDWVKGVLEKSLYHETLIDLGLEERPDAVTRPWDVQVQMPNRPNQVLPPGTPIIKVFDEAQGELLILGAPGAGKTTMLLELARDTLARARQNASLPIPVIFNLSSWTDPKQLLTAWLVDELINKYHVPKKVAEEWVEQNKLLLLLDGLDEVRIENRDTCVKAINTFRQAHGLNMPLVVCSRIADYEVLSTRLQLRGAVLLQPLTDEQIDDYFEQAGPGLASARHVWQQDAELQELARQPLMLSIMTLAYRGAAPEVLAAEQAGSLETRRKHLFNAYIQQMFMRVGRTKDERYGSKETIQYLAWLAHTLVGQGQSVFLLENMRSNWLLVVQQRLHKLLFRLVFVLVFGLAGGLVLGIPGKLLFGLVGGLSAGLIGVLVLGLVGGRSVEPESERPVEALQWSWKGAFDRLVSGLVVGLVGGLVLGLLGWLGVGRMFGLGDTWFGLKVGFEGMIGAGLVGGLVLGPVWWLWWGLLSGLEEIEMETKTVPNEGIRWSLKNGLMAGLMFGLAFGLVLGLAAGLAAGLGIGLVSGLVLGLAFMLLGWLIFGGSAVINHYLLRFLLQRSGYIPRHYEHFLDYAAEHLFLRRVGGSYVFVHRLLMEHFAEMWGTI